MILRLLKNPDFYNFLKCIKFYEWSNSHQLKEIDFMNYLQLFISKNYRSFLG